MSRARQILGRFPQHLEAGRAGKQLGVVTGALARDLDVDAARLAGIRRAHRLGEAGEFRDLLLLASLHGITRAELAIAEMRFAHAEALLSAMESESDPTEKERLAEQLIDLWSVEEPTPRLPLYEPPPPPPDSNGDPPDPDAKFKRLAAHVRQSLRHGHLLDAIRKRIATISRVHPGGNGTVRALLTGAANALDLDIGEISHSEDRFWHAALATDRVQLTRPVIEPPENPEAPASEITRPMTSGEEIIGIEENPMRRDQTDPRGRRHGDLFSVLRRGFDQAILQIRVTGDGNRTVGPMVVNRDSGHGVGYVGQVPDGQTLVFTEQGRVVLDGTDVTADAYAWRGACFAGSDARADRDFVFDGPGLEIKDPSRRATFAQATPVAGLDREASYPHAGVSLPMPGIQVGETRLAFFVQTAHFSSREGTDTTPVIRRVTPYPSIGFADNSVFAAGEDPRPIAARVQLSWLEHRAFVVRLLIPARFRELATGPDDMQVEQRVLQAIHRFRPIGVTVEVAYVDERWILGEGSLLGSEPDALDDPIARLRGATILWPRPPPDSS